MSWDWHSPMTKWGQACDKWIWNASENCGFFTFGASWPFVLPVVSSRNDIWLCPVTFVSDTLRCCSNTRVGQSRNEWKLCMSWNSLYLDYCAKGKKTSHFSKFVPYQKVISLSWTYLSMVHSLLNSAAKTRKVIYLPECLSFRALKLRVLNKSSKFRMTNPNEKLPKGPFHCRP